MKNLIITFVIFLSAIAYGQRDSTIYEIQGKATLADTDVLIVSGSDTVYYKITYAQLKTLLNAIYLVDADSTTQTVWTDLKLALKAPLASPTFTGQVTTAGIKTNTAVLGESHTLGADSCYGMVLYIGGAYTITLPAIAAGMSVTFITIGANAVVIEPGSGEQMYLDGTLLDANDSATNLSTAGDMIVFTYYGAGDWYAASNGWTDED